LGFTAGSTYSLTIGAEALRAAMKGVKGLYESFRKQPAWLQLAVAGALVAVAIHPKSRAKLLDIWEFISKGVQRAKKPLLEKFSARHERNRHCTVRRRPHEAGNRRCSAAGKEEGSSTHVRTKDLRGCERSVKD
jgi:hypothetical protein